MPIKRPLTNVEQLRANLILSKDPKSWTKDERSYLEKIDLLKIELSKETKEAIIEIYQKPLDYFTQTKIKKLLALDPTNWTIEETLFIRSMDLSKIRLPKSIIDSGINADIISRQQGN